MKQAARFASTLALLSGALLVGCVSTSFTASKEIDLGVSSRVAPEAVKLLAHAPSTPYRTLGEIEAQMTGFPSNKSILNRVRERAAAVGANAVVYTTAGWVVGQDSHWPALTYRPTTLTFTAIRLPDELTASERRHLTTRCSGLGVSRSRSFLLAAELDIVRRANVRPPARILRYGVFGFSPGARPGGWPTPRRLVDQVVRLAPDRFPQLPSSIRSYLVANGFTIPQCYLSTIFPGPHNVIRGHFRSATSTDWAVLASKGGVSRILVFFSGSGRDPTHLSEAPDSNFLQGPGEYSRHIRAASPKVILGYRRRRRG